MHGNFASEAIQVAHILALYAALAVMTLIVPPKRGEGENDWLEDGHLGYVPVHDRRDR